jgi:hypothetical protein
MSADVCEQIKALEWADAGGGKTWVRNDGRRKSVGDGGEMTEGVNQWVMGEK